MNEIQLVKPTITYVPCTITYDFEELDKQILLVEESMKAIKMEEDNLPVIKTYMTNLNKLADSLNGDKINIKKKAAPELPIFEKECMVRVNRIKAIRENMKKFSDSVADKKRHERHANVEEYLIKHREMDVPLEVIWNDEYYKMTDKKWKADVDYKLGYIKSEYAKLDNLAIDDIPLMKSLFLKHWDRTKARDAYDDIKAAEKKKEELINNKKMNSTPVVVNVVSRKEAQESVSDEPELSPIIEYKEEVVADIEEKTTCKTFRITGTDTEFRELIRYLVLNDMIYEEI